MKKLITVKIGIPPQYTNEEMEQALLDQLAIIYSPTQNKS